MGELRERLKIALDCGFEIYQTGGGCLALRKDDCDHYWMITDEDGPSIDGDPEAAAWIVGRYFESYEQVENGDMEANDYRWILIDDPITLRQALDLYAKIPEPTKDEEVLNKWSEIGIDVPRAAPEAPSPK